MSLPPILKVTLRTGLSEQELQDAFNQISLINGIKGMQASPSQENVLYCAADDDGRVDGETRGLPDVVSVIDFPLP